MVRREGERPVTWIRRRQDELWAPEAAHGRNPRIRRWIGAARRRAQRMRREEETGSAQVITLTWAQTFGRPSVPRTNAAPLAQTSLPEDRTVILLRRG